VFNILEKNLKSLNSFSIYYKLKNIFFTHSLFKREDLGYFESYLKYTDLKKLPELFRNINRIVYLSSSILMGYSQETIVFGKIFWYYELLKKWAFKNFLFYKKIYYNWLYKIYYWQLPNSSTIKYIYK
jgi:hypothetical protein